MIENVSADDETEISTDEPNVLVLDYAKFRINDGEFSEKKEILLIDCVRNSDLNRAAA